MKTVWENSHETETMRLLHTAAQIAKGFYHVNGFIVLPHPVQNKNSVVVLPDLPYITIHRFWNRVSKLNVDNFPMTIPSSLFLETQKILPFSKTSLPKTKKIWDKNQQEIINCIYQIMPRYKNRITKITVNPTAFGTACSFNLISKTGEIYVFLREDNIYTLVEAIITSLTRQDIYKNLNAVWQESEIIVDWLLSFSRLSDLLHKLAPDMSQSLTMKPLRGKQAASLKQQSRLFLAKVQAPKKNLESVKNLSQENLSNRDKSLLKLLIEKSPNIVTMDEIGDLLFADNPENFSLFAISKAIQRLRDSLEQNGISGSFIQTKRGEGYLLTS